jgi:hypothetical protein
MNRQRKSGTSQRKLRRANQVEQRKAVKGNGSSNFVTREQINEVVQQLNDNQQKLGQLINQTNRGLIQAFTIQDGHLHVMRRIYNDMAKEVLLDKGEGTLKLLGDGAIDWEWYYKEYEKTKVAIALVMWVKKLVGEEPVEVVKDEEDLVFGGDYESGAHGTDS